MKSNLIKIGNAKGVILPQSFLNQCSIQNEVIIEMVGSHILISNIGASKRNGWDDAFKQMAVNGDDKLIIPDFFEDEEMAD